MQIKSSLWQGSLIRLLCENARDEAERMSLVRNHLRARRQPLIGSEPLTQREIDLDNELAEWLAARDADYQF